MKKLYFQGKGDCVDGQIEAPPVINQNQLTAPEGYLTDDDLSVAVNIALTLGMPLLLTGEPGCGKSELARRVAWELSHHSSDNDKVDYSRMFLRYHVKSTTEAKDLFYTYDAVGRFHRAQSLQFEEDISFKEKTELIHPAEFIHFQALGLAILKAKGFKDKKIEDHILTLELKEQLLAHPLRSVVLIDEIDKAPRDVPNDILNELDKLEFTIPEHKGIKFGIDDGDAQYKPIVIFTSNSESELPEAFLRRCIYFHVKFPPFDNEREAEKRGDAVFTVDDIISSRLGDRFQHLKRLEKDFLRFCKFMREQHALTKMPGVAEMLNCLSCILSYVESENVLLDRCEEFSLSNINRSQLKLMLMTTLLKHEEDQSEMDGILERFFDER